MMSEGTGGYHGARTCSRGFGIHNPAVRTAFVTGRVLCHKGIFAGGVWAFGDGETGTTGGGARENTEEK